MRLFDYPVQLLPKQAWPSLCIYIGTFTLLGSVFFGPGFGDGLGDAFAAGALGAHSPGFAEPTGLDAISSKLQSTHKEAWKYVLSADELWLRLSHFYSSSTDQWHGIRTQVEGKVIGKDGIMHMCHWNNWNGWDWNRMLWLLQPVRLWHVFWLAHVLPNLVINR